MDNKTVLLFFSFLAVIHCKDLQSIASGKEETHVVSDGHLTVISGGHVEVHESTTAATSAGSRSGRQYYQPFAYQTFPQRRAYKNYSKKRPSRTKSGRRPRPQRRPAGPPSSMAVQMSRYRRFPPPLRTQQINYIDSTGVDYEDGFESAPQSVSLDYGDVDHEPSAAYSYGPVAAEAMSPVAPVAVMTAGRSRKRPAVAVSGFSDEPQTVVHVPVRIARPAAPAHAPATTTTTTSTADPMEKLRQLVHEAMDEHFANRHQDLYADGFDKTQQVYSAKYKRQQSAAAVNKDKQQQRTADGAKTSAVVPLAPPPPAKKEYSSDADADGSDDRLTLAEISAYMGARPAETVLSAGGHRYVLSDALQQSYRQQHNQQQPVYGGEDRHQYVRYVSPFEAVYELPGGARWTY